MSVPHAFELTCQEHSVSSSSARQLKVGCSSEQAEDIPHISKHTCQERNVDNAELLHAADESRLHGPILHHGHNLREQGQDKVCMSVLCRNGDGKNVNGYAFYCVCVCVCLSVCVCVSVFV
jgi:hypothetical protein